MVRNYRQLTVWQKSVDLSLLIYCLTENFPKAEIYTLTSQMRRCAISIPSNIAEGSERQSDKDFTRFLNIARGSLAELETQTIIANKLNYLSDNDYESLNSCAMEVGKMLNGLIKKLEAASLATGDL